VPHCPQLVTLLKLDESVIQFTVTQLVTLLKLDDNVVPFTVFQLVALLKLDDSVVLRRPTVLQLITSSKLGHSVALAQFPNLSHLCCWRVVLCVLSPSWSRLDTYSLTR